MKFQCGLEKILYVCYKVYENHFYGFLFARLNLNFIMKRDHNEFKQLLHHCTTQFL